MKMMNGTKALVVMSLALGAALSAHAAGPYTLTCDAARSGTLTIALTGYSVAVTGTGDTEGTGKGVERQESKFAVTVQFESGKDYDAMLSMIDDGELLRSCKLVDGKGGSGTSASDSWTQEAVKGKNKNKNNAPSESSAGGALEWILTNASVTSVTATGGPSSTGAPVTSLQATIAAQKFTFTM